MDAPNYWPRLRTVAQAAAVLESHPPRAYLVFPRRGDGDGDGGDEWVIAYRTAAAHDDGRHVEAVLVVWEAATGKFVLPASRDRHGFDSLGECVRSRLYLDHTRVVAEDAAVAAPGEVPTAAGTTAAAFVGPAASQVRRRGGDGDNSSGVAAGPAPTAGGAPTTTKSVGSGRAARGFFRSASLNVLIMVALVVSGWATTWTWRQWHDQHGEWRQLRVLRYCGRHSAAMHVAGHRGRGLRHCETCAVRLLPAARWLSTLRAAQPLRPNRRHSGLLHGRLW